MSRTAKSPEVLDLDRADLDFAQEVVEAGAEGLRNCYGCGACSAFCPILPKAEGYDPRRLIRLVLLGQRELVLGQPLIWYCSTCYSCHEVCPQQVSFTEISFALKNLAVAAGSFPAGLPSQVELLSSFGRLYEVGEFENEKRASLGLPPQESRGEDYRRLLAGLAADLQGADPVKEPPKDEKGGGGA